VKIKKIIFRVSSDADKFARISVVVLILALTATITFEVFFRYFLKMPLIGTEELARYIMIWLTFVGSSIALRQKAHIGMVVLLKFLPEQIKRRMIYIIQGLILIFLAHLIWWGWVHAVHVKVQLSPALRISMFWPFISIPIGGFLMFIQQIALIAGIEKDVAISIEKKDLKFKQILINKKGVIKK
jgi:TRAP-type C4-dicarboxylate transport system permease small subunit